MTFNRPTFFLLLAALFLSACATPDVRRPISDLSPTEVINALGLSGSDWGYHVIDANTGSEIASYQSDIPQPPASTAKLPTMIASLSILGAGFRFETSLLTNGAIVGDTLNGDLVLRGTGDPLLRTNDLRDLAARLHDQGVREITGNFAYDSTLPTFSMIEADQPQTAPYNQGISGLNVDFNRARLTQELTASGHIQSYLTPVEATGLTPSVDGFPPRHVTDVPINRPDVLVARLFRKFAAFEGIHLPEPIAYQPGPALKLIANIHSLPLHEITRVGLEYSNNMVSEVIGLSASSALQFAPTSLSQSSKRLTMWLDQNLMKDTRFAPFLVNHSGLSVASRISPKYMTNLLRYALNQRFNGHRFDQLLPPGGGREGYRGRFRAPDTAFRIWGKTGSMRYIKGLAGYIDPNSGRRLAFAIFTNDLPRRNQLGHARNMDDKATRADASAWRNRAEDFESEMIRRWISNH
mgnify:CR=1 FL=1